MKKNYTRVMNFLLMVPLFLVLISSNQLLDHQLGIRFVFLSVILTATSFILVFQKKEPIKFSKTTSLLTAGIVGFLLSAALSLTYTINLADGVYVVLKYSLIAIQIVILIFHFSDIKTFALYFSRTIVLIGIVLVGWAAVQIANVYITEGITHAKLYNVTVAFGHKNLFTEYLILIFPLGAFSAFIENKWKKLPSILLLAFILLYLIIFMTRSTWVALAGSSIVVFALILLTGQIKISFKRIIFISFPVIVFIAVAVLIYSKADTASTFTKQIKSTTNFNYGTVKDRLILWQKSIDLAKEAPITGHGAGSWKIHILKENNQELRSENNIIFYQRPHNDYIWILCEQGIIGLALFCIIIIMMYILVYEILKKETDKQNKNFSLTLIFSFTAYLFVSLFSFPLDRIAHPVIFAFTIAGIIILYRPYIKPVQVNRLWVIASLCLFTVIGGFSTYAGNKRLTAEKHVKKAFDYRAAQRWKKVITEMNEAENAYYKIDPFSTPLAWYRGLAYFAMQQTKMAANEFEKAHKLNPNHIYVLNDLATSKLLLKSDADAVKYYKKALKIAPNFDESLYNMSAYFHQKKMPDSAVNYFTRISETNSPKYDKYMRVIVKPYIIALTNQISEEKINQTLKRISVSDKWMKNIITKSRTNKYTLKKQLLTDVFFVLNEEGNTFTQEQQDMIINQYLN